jgi:heptosyltransferase-2
LINERFNVGLSARSGDPRDHLLLLLARAKRRIGFPRMGSQMFLTEPLQQPDPLSHRYEYWCTLAGALEITMPRREELPVFRQPANGEVLIHSGAGQPVRVWPLERYRILAQRLRERNVRVRVACDPDQRNWWLRAGETNVATPESVAELFSLIDRAGVFIGNDSGPGHLAAFCGVPTLTLFGPQVPEWFAPLPSAAEWIEGTACPYKPCSDYCRFSAPRCLLGLDEPEVWKRVESFVARYERAVMGVAEPVT